MVYLDWGLIPYKEAWNCQLELFNERILAKQTQNSLPDLLVFCEHPPVYTLGKSGAESNLLVSQTDLLEKGVEFFYSDRGGDITFHGPGQIVCYPILDLEHLEIGLRQFLFALEEAVILFLADNMIVGQRLEGATGVWIQTLAGNYRKICAMGVRSSKFVTMHGLALNIRTDLSYYDNINPCGFTDKGVTSLQQETGLDFDMESCKKQLFKHLCDSLHQKRL